MHDPANDLRQLVRQDGRLTPVHGIGRPKLVAVAGGKGGVGTTTVAINLAVALARQKYRTLLVDGDPDGGDVAMLCRLKERYTLADVLSARKTVLEAFQAGPGGISVLPSVWAAESISDCWASAAARLIGPLENLGSHFDCVVLDVGDCLNRMVRQFWQAADMVLLVTGAELTSVMDAYGSIKVLAALDKSIRIHSLVNMAPTRAVADDTHDRLARACRRFLAVDIASAGYLPADPDVKYCGEKREPFVTVVPKNHSTCLLRRLARSVATTKRKDEGGRLRLRTAQRTIPNAA